MASGCEIWQLDGEEGDEDVVEEGNSGLRLGKDMELSVEPGYDTDEENDGDWDIVPGK